jgi:hypothetical protein
VYAELILFSRPIHDFKSLVSPEQLARIKDVFYIDSKDSLAEFSSFIYGLGVKKITGECSVGC